MTYARCSGPRCDGVVRTALGGDGLRVGVELEELGPRGFGGRVGGRRRDRFEEVGVASRRDDERHARVGDHEREPGARVVRVQRQVGAAGGEDAEDRDDEVDAAIDGEPHQRLRPDAAAPERAREEARAPIELGVGDARGLEREGDGGGRARGLGLKELVEASVHREGGHSTAQREEAPGLLRGEQGEVVDGLRGVAADAVEEGAEALEQALDRRGVVEVGVVLGADGEIVGALGDDQAQVELGAAVGDLAVGRLDAGQAQRGARRGEEAERDARERIVAQAPIGPPRLDDLGEGDVLAEDAAQDLLVDALGERAKRHPVGHLGAQDDHVGEVADDRVRREALAAGDGDQHHDVALAGPPRQEDVEPGQEAREERHVGLGRDRAQAGHHRRGDVDDRQIAAVAAHRRPRPVRRELARGRAREARGPVVELPRERRRLQPAALGLDVGAVRVGRRRQGQRAVEGPDLAPEDAQRRAVGDDVIHHHHQRVILRGEPVETDAEQGPPREVERGGCGGAGEAPRFGLGLGRGGEVDGGHVRRHALGDDLEDGALDGGEGRAEALVAPYHLAHGGEQRGLVELALEPELDGGVVRRRVRHQLPQEPEARLAEGRRREPGRRR